MCLCVQLHRDWQLGADMPLTGAGWGIIYPLCVHDAHPDLADYDRHMGLADIVTGESSEPLDAAAQKRRRDQLTKVKRENRDATSDDDDEVGRPENNPGILENKRKIEEAKAKRQRR